MTDMQTLAVRKAAWEAGEQSTYQPRRRRTIVCPHLREDGHPLPPDTWPAFWARLPKTVTAYGTSTATRALGVFRCTRRAAELSPSFVIDRCASTWCNDCEWRTPEPMRSREVSLSFQRRSA